VRAREAAEAGAEIRTGARVVEITRVASTGGGTRALAWRPAPVTGRLMAQAYCGEPSPVELAPFEPDRFGR
jgi:hypothetical protein